MVVHDTFPYRLGAGMGRFPARQRSISSHAVSTQVSPPGRSHPKRGMDPARQALMPRSCHYSVGKPQDGWHLLSPSGTMLVYRQD